RVVDELPLVGGAGRTAFCAGAVIGDDHDQGVVVLADALEIVEQATNVVVGMRQKAGEDLHHACVELLLLWGERIPVRYIWIVTRQFSISWDDAERFLTGEDFFA